MRRGWLFGGLATLALASALWARPGVVHLKDGTPLAGDVDETESDQVTITLHGVHEIIPRTDIDSIEYPGSLDEQYGQRMDKLADGDVAGRLAVASWARAAGRYDLARRAAAEASSIDPTSQKARELLHDINAEASLSHSATTRVSVFQPATAPALSPTARSGEKPYLTADQINTIRQLELKPDDAFRVTFIHDVRQRFLALGTMDSGTFYALSAIDQARQIFGAGNASMVGDVRIDTDPAAMAEYHARIQPFILGGCAVNGCHNSVTAAGGFGLFTGDESPGAWYTNFYIVQTYVRPATKAGAAERLMIDRTQPENSLLLNYGLLPSLAAVPHPPAANLHPMFTTRSDPRYQSFIHWMSMMLRPDGGSYAGIDYRPPWSLVTSPVTSRATTPVTTPVTSPRRQDATDRTK